MCGLLCVQSIAGAQTGGSIRLKTLGDIGTGYPSDAIGGVPAAHQLSAAPAWALLKVIAPRSFRRPRSLPVQLASPSPAPHWMCSVEVQPRVATREDNKIKSKLDELPDDLFGAGGSG